MSDEQYEKHLADAEASHPEAIRLFKAGWRELHVAMTEIQRWRREARQLREELQGAPAPAIAASLNAVQAIWTAIKADGEQHMIRVWSFGDAPEPLQRLSTNGGDEDWLAWVPPTLADAHIAWLESGPFGSCTIDRYGLPDGTVVYIGSHA